MTSGSENGQVAADAQESLKAFGALLRKTREQAGFTIEQIAESTRILQPFVRALEDGEFHKLPGAVFGRGFLKSICKTMGVEPTPLLAAFARAVGAPLEKSSLQVPVHDSVAKFKFGGENDDRFANVGGWLQNKYTLLTKRQLTFSLAVGAVIIVVLSLLLGFPRSTTPEKPAAPQSIETTGPSGAEVQPANEEEETAEAAKEVAPPDAATVAGAAKNPAVEPPPAAAADPVEQAAEYKVAADPAQGAPHLLVFAVKSPVKVRMRIDNDKWTTTQLEPQKYEFQFNESAEFLVFNAAAVDIAFDGKALGSLGKEGRVRRLSFMAKNEASENKQNL